MGQKVNPIGLRLGINRTSDSRWYADTADFGRLLHEDIAIRKEIRKRLKQAGISKIIIERPHKKCLITIHTARPGLVIGKKGGDIEALRKVLSKMTTDEVRVNLVEIRKPEIDAHAARRHRLRHCRSCHHLRHHRDQGLGLQRRDHGARPDGSGQASGIFRPVPCTCQCKPARTGHRRASLRSVRDASTEANQIP